MRKSSSRPAETYVLFFSIKEKNWVKKQRTTKIIDPKNKWIDDQIYVSSTVTKGYRSFQASSAFSLGVPASQPHMPLELCLCFAFRACSEAAFCLCSSSSSFCRVSIVCSFCRSSATSTC